MQRHLRAEYASSSTTTSGLVTLGPIFANSIEFAFASTTRSWSRADRPATTVVLTARPQVTVQAYIPFDKAATWSRIEQGLHLAGPQWSSGVLRRSGEQVPTATVALRMQSFGGATACRCDADPRNLGEGRRCSGA